MRERKRERENERKKERKRNTKPSTALDASSPVRLFCSFQVSCDAALANLAFFLPFRA